MSSSSSSSSSLIESNTSTSSVSSMSSISSSTSLSSEENARNIDFTLRGTKWSVSKLICTGIPSIKNTLVFNKQCQSVKIRSTSYTIRSVSLFLRKFNSETTSYPLVLEIYDTDNYGLPLNLIDQETLSSDNVSKEGWYSFDFGDRVVDKVTPDNQTMAFVFYQNGGDETNYTNWYYSLDTSSLAKAYVSKDDGLTWTEQPNVIRAMGILDIFDFFEEAYVDSEKNALSFQPGSIAKQPFAGSAYFSQGNFDNTEVMNDCVEIQHKPIVVSIVVDSSGSMGWNDRYQTRNVAIQEMISSLKEKYPNQSLFDIISFGSFRIDGKNSTSSPSQNYITQKIDLNNPKKTTLNSDGSSPAISDGLLSYGFKDLEEGHEYILASAYFSPSHTNIENGMGSFDVDLGMYVPVNYQNLGTQLDQIKFSLDHKGPGSEKSLSKAISALIFQTSYNTNVVRKPFFSNRQANLAFITKNIQNGDTTIYVDNFEHLPIGSIVDIFDQNNVASGLKIIDQVASESNNSIVVDTPVLYDFSNSFEEYGCLLQESSLVSVLKPSTNDTMVEFLLKDSLTTKAITFYFQTQKGGIMEWDIFPFKEWQSLFLYYAGETTPIKIVAVDTDGNPVPNKTRSDIYVDGEGRAKSETDTDAQAKKYSFLRNPVKSGEDSFILYKEDKETKSLYENIKIDDTISLNGKDEELDVFGTHTVVTIEEKTETDPETLVETKTKTVIFDPVHMDSWDATTVMIISAVNVNESLKLDVPISAVDISPTAAGRKLDPALLQPQDPPQVDPSSSPNDFNQSPERKRDGLINFPLIGGTGRIRVLPITDEQIELPSEKNKKAALINETTSLSYDETVEKTILENEYLLQTSQTKKQLLTSLEAESVTTEISKKFVSPYYTVDTPVYLYGGQATSNMTAMPQEMTEVSFEYYKYSFIEDLNTSQVPIENKMFSSGNILAKSHTVETEITVATDTKTITQQLNSSTMYFASPIQMSCCVVGNFKSYCAVVETPTGTVTKYASVPFIYALSEEKATIYYNVFYKGVFLKNGQIKIKIFDKNRSASDMVSPTTKDIQLQGQGSGLAAQGGNDIITLENKYKKTTQEPTYIDTIKLQEATFLNGYTAGGVSVDVVNGRASLTIQSSSLINFDANLMIVAEITSPNDSRRSTVISNIVFVVSPLEIIPIINGKKLSGAPATMEAFFRPGTCPIEDRELLSGNAQAIYNFGAQITWFGNPIEDDVPVFFETHEHYRTTGVQEKPKIEETTTEDLINQIQNIQKQIGSGNTSTDEISAEGTTNGTSTEGTTESSSLENSAVSGEISSMFPPTPTSPSVSKTIDGTAQDSMIGPHETVINHYRTVTSEGEKVTVTLGDVEVVKIKTTYNNVNAFFPVRIMWMGPEDGSEDDGTGGNVLYFVSLLYKDAKVVKSSRQELWADGWDYAIGVVDLAASYVGGYEKIEEITPYLTGGVVENGVTLKPQVASFGTYGKGIFSKSIPVDPTTNQPIELLVSNDGSTPIGWSVSPPIKKAFIPSPPTDINLESKKCQPCIPYECEKIIATSVAKINPTKAYSLRGCKFLSSEDCRCWSGEPPKPSSTTWYTPIIDWKNPIETATTIMGENSYIKNEIIMDGNERTRFDIEISFSGFPIPFVAKKRGITQFWSPEWGRETNKNSNINPWQKYSIGSQNISTNILNGVYMANKVNDMLFDSYYNYYTDVLKEWKEGRQKYGETWAGASTVQWVNPFERQAKSTAWKDYFPTIICDIYIAKEKLNEETEEITIVDKRYVKSLSLTQKNITLSIEYTSTGSATETEEHFHKVSIGENGNGETTKTFLSGTFDEIENHTHDIEDFAVKESTSTEISHTHKLKSSATTFINPFTLESLGYVESKEMIVFEFNSEYDASSAFVKRPIKGMTTKSVYPSSLPPDKRWTLSVSTPGTVKTQLSTTNNYDGYNIDLLLQRGDGLMPPDGTRVDLEILPYRVEAVQPSKDIVLDSQTPRQYMLLKIVAKTEIEGQKIKEKDIEQYVVSTINWFPKIKKLLPEITDDEIYISNALSKIESVGPSQINDAIANAVGNIKQYILQNKNTEIFPSIILFTDGDENLSVRNFSYLQGLFSAGIKIPIYCLGIGNLLPTSKKLLEAYSSETGGFLSENKLATSSEIIEQINKIISEQGFNSGIYQNNVELVDNYIIKKFIPSVSLIDGSTAKISFRVGKTQNAMSEPSEEIEILSNGQEIDIEGLFGNDKNKYLSYSVSLNGNEELQSPLFCGGYITYISPRSCKVFSQPIEISTNPEDFVSEITITHKATVSDMVEIEYSICPMDSTKEMNYYNQYILPCKSGERNIIVSRNNEAMKTSDFQTYYAVNGSWDKDIAAKLYYITNDVKTLIPPTEYEIYPLEGRVYFYQNRSTDYSEYKELLSNMHTSEDLAANALIVEEITKAYEKVTASSNGTVLLSLEFPQKFRILCKVKNNSVESAFIDHIGLMYNTGKRQ